LAAHSVRARNRSISINVVVAVMMITVIVATTTPAATSESYAPPRDRRPKPYPACSPGSAMPSRLIWLLLSTPAQSVRHAEASGAASQSPHWLTAD
jgi:hypothetical protein